MSKDSVFASNVTLRDDRELDLWICSRVCQKSKRKQITNRFEATDHQSGDIWLKANKSLKDLFNTSKVRMDEMSH